MSFNVGDSRENQGRRDCTSVTGITELYRTACSLKPCVIYTFKLKTKDECVCVLVKVKVSLK